MALRFNCEHCGNKIILKFLVPGEFADCKLCGKKSVVPENAEEIDSEATADSAGSGSYLKQVSSRIYENLNKKSTEELRQIWIENDRTNYRSEAFSVIRRILQERGEDIPRQKTLKEEEIQAGGTGGFFSFRIMVSTILIKIIYFLGMVGISLDGLYIIIKASERRHVAVSQVILGLGILILGNLLWRIVCEVWILFFSIHDILKSIEKKIKSNN